MKPNKNIKHKKIITLARPFIDLNKAATCFLRLGIVFSPLSGLSTLRVRKPFKLIPAVELEVSRMNSIRPETTIMKSRMFQGSLKYVLNPQKAPNENSLIRASTKNINRKT